jgi:lipopolysaccharide transport system permease protein
MSSSPTTELTSQIPPTKAGPPKILETIEITPRRGFLDLDLNGVWRSRELLTFLVMRDLRVRYKQAALGAAWAVLQPLFSVLVFTLIFGVFAKFPSAGIPYPVFAFASLLPWTYFSEATRRSTLSLVGDSDLIRKIYFPRLIIPMATVVTPLLDFLVSFIVLLAMMLFYDITPTVSALLALPMLALPMLLAFAIGLWLGPLNVAYRDVTQIVPFALQVGMYASPIVYPLSMVPEKWRGLYSLNPMVGTIEAFRWVLFGVGEINLQAIFISLGFTVVLLTGGLIFFRMTERSFADLI